jgi:Uma2 family endonuclease
MVAILKLGEIEADPVLFDRETVGFLIESGAADALGRFEMIDGVLIQTSQMYDAHAVALSELMRFFLNALPRDLKVLTDAAIFLEDRLMLAPDIAILPRSVVSQEASGPDLKIALEIADTTAARDLRYKPGLYGTHGVPEYWMVDLKRRMLHLHREPGPDGYGSVAAQDWDTPASPLFAPDLTLHLSDILKDIG